MTKNKKHLYSGKILTPILIAVLIGTFISALQKTGFFEEFKYELINIAFKERKKVEINPNIVTIDIDDPSISTVGRWPWPINVHSQIIDFLSLYNAKAVVLTDIDFKKEIFTSFDTNNKEKFKEKIVNDFKNNISIEDTVTKLQQINKDFNSVLKKTGNVFTTINFKLNSTTKGAAPLGVYSSQTEEDFVVTVQTTQKNWDIDEILIEKKIGLSGIKGGNFPSAFSIVYPQSEILESVKGAGFNTIQLDKDGIVRRYPLLAYYKNTLYPSVVLKLAEVILKDYTLHISDEEHIMFSNKKDSIQIPSDSTGAIYINWVGEYKKGFPHIPFNLVGFFLAQQIAKDTLNELMLKETSPGDDMLKIYFDTVVNLRLLPKEDLNAIAADIAFCAYIEEKITSQLTTVEEIMQEGGYDTQNSRLVKMAKQVLFNNYMYNLYESSGDIPDFLKIVEELGIAQNDWNALQLSYETMSYHIKNKSVNRVRPLVFDSATVELQGKTKTITPAFFNDKIVFYGLTATGLSAQHPTPFMRRHPMIDLLPNILNTITTKDFIKELSPIFHYIIIYAVVALTVLLTLYLKPLRAVLLITLFVILYLILTWTLFAFKGFIMPLTAVVFTIILTYTCILAYRYSQDRLERKEVRRMFSTMVSPEVLQIMENSPESFTMASEKKYATMFSSDVSGFTTISEGVTSKELANILNAYLTPMSNIIMAYGGYVDKYEGDAIKAAFGVPLSDEGHAWKTCYAAIYQQEELELIQRMILLKYGVQITARMGINTGLISAGNMGSEKHMQYTVLGEEVTIAEELEPANKLFNTWIMISESTLNDAKEYIDVRYLSNLEIGYQGRFIKTYELQGWKKDKFMEYWQDKPIPDILIDSIKKSPPEKVLAYYDYFANKQLSNNQLIADLKNFFSTLHGLAMECMKLECIVTLILVETELSNLQKDIGQMANSTDLSETIYNELLEMEIEIGKDIEPWRRILLKWRKLAKRFSGSLQTLKGKLEKATFDVLLNRTDIVEKNIETIYKRILYGNSNRNDDVASLLADHLKDLIETYKMVKEQYSNDKYTLLLHKIESIRSDINEKVEGFTETLKKRNNEYHELISEFGTISKEQYHVNVLFEKGQRCYIKQQWSESVKYFKSCLDYIPNDGPSITFLKKLKSL